jgi:hypothetical protein
LTYLQGVVLDGDGATANDEGAMVLVSEGDEVLLRVVLDDADVLDQCTNIGSKAFFSSNSHFCFLRRELYPLALVPLKCNQRVCYSIHVLKARKTPSL